MKLVSSQMRALAWSALAGCSRGRLVLDPSSADVVFTVLAILACVLLAKSAQARHCCPGQPSRPSGGGLTLLRYCDHLHCGTIHRSHRPSTRSWISPPSSETLGRWSGPHARRWIELPIPAADRVVRGLCGCGLHRTALRLTLPPGEVLRTPRSGRRQA